MEMNPEVGGEMLNNEAESNKAKAAPVQDGEDLGANQEKDPATSGNPNIGNDGTGIPKVLNVGGLSKKRTGASTADDDMTVSNSSMTNSMLSSINSSIGGKKKRKTAKELSELDRLIQRYGRDDLFPEEKFLPNPEFWLSDKEPKAGDDAQKGIIYRDLLEHLEKQAGEGVNVKSLIETNKSLIDLIEGALSSRRNELSTSIKRAVWGKNGK